jgi:hypothetical protein
LNVDFERETMFVLTKNYSSAAFFKGSMLALHNFPYILQLPPLNIFHTHEFFASVKKSDLLVTIISHKENSVI